MAEVKIGRSVSKTDTLWRYMSLDKLINFLEKKALYFTPLSSYERSDPFEGYPPKIVLRALSSVIGKEQQGLEEAYQKLIDFANKNDPLGQNEFARRQLSDLRVQMDSMDDTLRNSFKSLVKGVTVNCWHRSRHESEAMWKLYSETGKGVAIKTTVDSLVTAINSEAQNLLIQIGGVKYINFDDPDMQIGDCFTDGVLTPLLKRISFSHENEVRLFIVPDIDHEAIDLFQPKPHFIGVDTERLIEEIYISPFAGEPFTSSAITICEKYGIEASRLKKSSLLEGHSDLLAALTVSAGNIHN